MIQQKFALSVLPEKLGSCRLAEKGPIPAWAQDIDFAPSRGRKPNYQLFVLKRKSRAAF